MGILHRLLGPTPFAAVAEHGSKVQECARQIGPLTTAWISGENDEVHRIQDEISRLEYEADQIKHAIRETLPNHFFLPVDKEDLEKFLSCQDAVADAIEDLAVILLIRETRLHPELQEEMHAFVAQVIEVTGILFHATEQLLSLVETSFEGTEADRVLAELGRLGEEEWKADRMQRAVSKHVYRLEGESDPTTILFYDKILIALGDIANAAENAGDVLRTMIIKD